MALPQQFPFYTAFSNRAQHARAMHTLCYNLRYSYATVLGSAQVATVKRC
jgi:hypothetical protein